MPRPAPAAAAHTATTTSAHRTPPPAPTQITSGGIAAPGTGTDTAAGTGRAALAPLRQAAHEPGRTVVIVAHHPGATTSAGHGLSLAGGHLAGGRPRTRIAGRMISLEG